MADALIRSNKITKAIFAKCAARLVVKDAKMPQGIKINREAKVIFDKGISLVWFNNKMMYIISKANKSFSFPVL